MLERWYMGGSGEGELGEIVMQAKTNWSYTLLKTLSFPYFDFGTGCYVALIRTAKYMGPWRLIHGSPQSTTSYWDRRLMTFNHS